MAIAEFILLVVQKRSPHWWLGAWLISTVVITFAISPLRDLRADYPIATFSGIIFLVVVVYLLTFLAIGSGIINYEIRARSLGGLLWLYLELILLFAVVYYLFILLDSSSVHLKGAHQIWCQVQENKCVPQEYSISNAGLAFLDCVHFSVVTTATVGYGDIVPQSWWLKMIVDLQILFSSGLVLIGLGRYFSK